GPGPIGLAHHLSHPRRPWSRRLMTNLGVDALPAERRAHQASHPGGSTQQWSGSIWPGVRWVPGARAGAGRRSVYGLSGAVLGSRGSTWSERLEGIVDRSPAPQVARPVAVVAAECP